VTPLDGALAALIARGEARPRDLDPHALLDASETHQVVPLVAQALHAIDPDAPASRTLHAAAAAWALREQSERAAMAALLDAAHDVQLIVFKGAATAYGLYPHPWLRMREDWDVIVAPGDGDRMRAALDVAGFVPDAATKPGAIRMRQRSYRREVPGSQCIVDLHDRVLNPVALSEAITYETLARETVPLPSLHASARGPDDAAALVLAATHRLAHHSGEPRLAWDCDVLLLLRRLGSGAGRSVDRAAELARTWGVSALVEAEVRRILARFGEPAGPHVRHLLDSLGDSGATTVAARPFLRERRSRAREFALDWRALGWRARLALMRETLVPDPAFIDASRPSRAPMPARYLWRILRGMIGWFRR